MILFKATQQQPAPCWKKQSGVWIVSLLSLTFLLATINLKRPVLHAAARAMSESNKDGTGGELPLLYEQLRGNSLRNEQGLLFHTRKVAKLVPDTCQTSPTMAAFDQIYQEGKWSHSKMLDVEDFYSNAQWPPKARNSGSGGGSLLGSNTETSLDILRKTIVKYNVTAMIDLPCGDTNWIFDSWETDSLPLYIGLDVVGALIERNSKRLQHHSNKIFAHWDGTACRLPKYVEDSSGPGGEPKSVDLIHSRDVIQHLPLEEGVTFLCNIIMSGARILVATTYPGENADIPPGAWAHTNLHAPPYDLPDLGNCVETHPHLDGDSTCVYDLSGDWVADWSINKSCSKRLPQ